MSHSATLKRSSLGAVRLVIAALLLVAVSFVLGAALAAWQGWFQPMVAVTIQNKTSQTVNELVLSFKSARSNGVLTLPVLPVGTQTVARFYHSGEGTFELKATLADGTVLVSQEAYIEPGYTATELLLDSGTRGSVQYAGATR